MKSYCIAVYKGVYLSMPEFYVSEELHLTMLLNQCFFSSIGDYGSEILAHFFASGVLVHSDRVYVFVNSDTYKLLKKALKEFIIS